MQSFLFSPELFECRTKLLEAFEKQDLLWFRDFQAVDVDHDSFGLDITGIKDVDDTFKMLMVVNQVFPDWKWGQRIYDDSSIDPGWRLFVSKHKRPPPEERWGSDENWDTDEGWDSDEDE